MKVLLLLMIVCVMLPGCGASEEKPSVKAEPENRRLFKPPLLKEKGSTNMVSKLDAELLSEIDWHVRAGFYDKADLMRIFCEEMYAPGDLDETLVSAKIDSQLAALEEKKKTWPAVTDCDRLNLAFAGMEKRGLIALQNAGNTQTDGYEIFEYCLEEEHPQPETVIGYCFYHNQDLERAVAGDDLYLAFGPRDSKVEETKRLEVGNIVREELERAGLQVEW
ncbi:hypothetical protein, partial [uncultured Gimesia sp.]|uniref:DUF6891 domain-containing protein n=1 Tax=uncultured Gimesia sp. TaxID=1678688 RepID=UPI0026203138